MRLAGDDFTVVNIEVRDGSWYDDTVAFGAKRALSRQNLPTPDSLILPREQPLQRDPTSAGKLRAERLQIHGRTPSPRKRSLGVACG